MRRGVIAAAGLCAGALLAAPSWSSGSFPATAEIQGRVVDLGTGAPVPSAQIVIVGSRQGTLSSTGGIFQLLDVLPGNHEIRVHHPCFWPVTVEIEVEEGTVHPVRLDAGLSLKPVRHPNTLGGCASFLPDS